MELRSGVPLELGERRLLRQAPAVGPVAHHRVVAVRDDQEVGRQGQCRCLDSVVALPVEPLVVIFDRAGLRGGEAEPAQEPG